MRTHSSWLMVPLVLGLVAGCAFDESGLRSPSNNNNENGNVNTNQNQNNNHSSGTCGDGQVGLGELCDDGNAVAGDGCGADCRPEAGWACPGEPSVCAPICGDGLVVGGEQCDDGNLTPRDGCDIQCRLEHGYTCTGEPSTCTHVCGDGLLALGLEGCDDGNTDPADGCSNTCVVEPGWVCWGEPSTCAQTCGNGTLDTGEVCDDGNNDPCVGLCSADCSRFAKVCGDGFTECGEVCDDGNTDPCVGGCAADCGRAANVCGDHISECLEVCDDGNTTDCDGCAADCSRQDNQCGDGITECLEACDDGNTDACTGSCAADCSRAGPVCGDHLRECGEACEDSDFGSATCSSLTGGTLPGGSLTCTTGCTIDTSGCTGSSCTVHGDCPLGQQCQGTCVPVGNTCDDSPTPLTAGSHDDTLDNLTNDYNGGQHGLACPGLWPDDTAGADRAYEIQMNPGDWFSVWLSPVNFNGVLYVISNCGSATCHEGVEEGFGEPTRERLDFIASAADTYYLIVDGNPDDGDYTLDVTLGSIADFNYPSPGSLIFTEVQANPGGPTSSSEQDDCEWFEVANPSNSKVIALHGATFGSPDGGFDVNRPILVQPNEHVVFARYANRSQNCNVDWVTRSYGYTSSFNLEFANPCQLDLTLNSTTVVDSITYSGGTWPFADGQSMFLCTNHYSATDNNAPDNWATTPSDPAYRYDGTAPENFGTPAAPGPSTCN